MPERAASRVLIVAPQDEATAALVAELGPHLASAVPTLAEAQAALAAGGYALVLTVIELPDGSGLDLLASLQATDRFTARMLWARYDELPKVIRMTAHERVLARPGRAATQARALRERLDFGDPFNEGNHTTVHGELFSTALRTTNAFARLRGAVVRSLPKDAPIVQLQLVVPIGDDLEVAREGLVRYYGAATKARGQASPTRPLPDALRALLGNLERDQELFFGRPSSTQSVYVAIFPWRREAKCTVVIGILTDGDEFEAASIIRAVRERVVQEMGEFAVPRLDEQTLDKARYVPDYDWVVTAQYAGPDRRAKPTGFANSFLVFGKRKELPGGLETGGGFVDRFKPWVLAAFAAYLLLSSIDTVLTWVIIGGGRAQELNPVLRPLIGTHPVAFVVVKNLFSIGSFFCVARFQLFRLGKLLVAANLLLYVVLDLYWARLILGLLQRLK